MVELTAFTGEVMFRVAVLVDCGETVTVVEGVVKLVRPLVLTFMVAVAQPALSLLVTVTVKDKVEPGAPV